MAPLFEAVVYFIPDCVPRERRIDLARLLDENGAVEGENIATSNHVITTSLDYPGLDALPDHIKLTTPFWVERSVMLSMKQNPRFYSPNPLLVFSGVVACASDIPKGDKEAISAGILGHGGQWREGLTKEVTHLFCLVPDGLKYRTAMSHREITRIVVLLPHWFDDCFKTQMLLPTTQYEFPDPPLFNPEKAAANNATVRSLLDRPRKQPIGTDIWQGKRILLSSTVDLEEGRRESVETMIERFGGVVIRVGEGETEEDVVVIADLFITRWRSGEAYFAAVQREISVGTLAYLLEVHNTGVITLPTDNLLHYPTRSWDPPGFESQVITITNYSGLAREYLRNLIQTMGATFTPTLSSKNTAVIAAHTSGNKTDKAKEWRIPVVSHVWLEDCFIDWKYNSPAMPQYLTFPPGVNFMAMVGSKTLGRIGPETLPDLEMEIKMNNAEKEKALAKSKEEEVATKKAVDDAYNKGLAEGSKKIAHTTDSLARPRNTTDKPTVQRRLEFSFLASGTSAREVERAVFGADDDVGMDVDGPPDGVSNGMDDDRLQENHETGLTDLYSNSSSQPTIRTSPQKKSSFHGPASKRPGSTASPMALKETSANVQVPTRNMDTATRRQTAPRRAMQGSQAARDNQAQKQEEEESSIPGLIAHKSPAVGSKSLDTASEKPAPAGKRTADPAKRNTVRELFGEPGSTSSPKSPRTKLADSAEQVRRQPSGRVLSVEIVRTGSPSRTTIVGDPVPTPKIAEKSKRVAGPSTPTAPPSRQPAHGSSSKKTGGPRPPWADDPERRAAKGKWNRPPTTPPVGDDDEEEARGSEDEEMEDLRPQSGFRKPSKRGAAAKASQMLGAAMADANSFQKEMQRGRIEIPVGASGTAAPSKRRRKDVDTITIDGESERDVKKRRMLKPRGTDMDSMSEGEGANTRMVKSKKAAVEWDPSDPTATKVNPSKIQLVITQVLLQPEETKAITSMGARIVKTFEDPNQRCTHLVAKAIQRTEKFLCAISSGPYIVGEDWLKDSITAGRFLAEDDYLLCDDVNEKRYQVDIAASVRRAKRNPKKLLQGHTFYMTEHVQMGMDTLKRILGAAGGILDDQRRPIVRMLIDTDNRHVIADPSDQLVWRPLRVAGIPIYTKEMILNVILKQEADWNDPSTQLNL